jgi:hypothetical protein
MLSAFSDADIVIALFWVNHSLTHETNKCESVELKSRDLAVKCWSLKKLECRKREPNGKKAAVENAAAG